MDKSKNKIDKRKSRQETESEDAENSQREMNASQEQGKRSSRVKVCTSFLYHLSLIAGLWGMD